MLDVKSKESTKETLRKQTDQYLKKVQLGKEIHDYLMKNTHIREGCLTEDLSSALDLYKKTNSCLDIESIELRPWQKQVIELIDEPSDREIIWIIGKKGNEGKFFEGKAAGRG